MNAPSLFPAKRAAVNPAHSGAGVFSSLQREVDRLFDDFSRLNWSPFSQDGVAVSVDLVETKDGVELTAEVPGLQEKDVQVTLSDNILTISGEKQGEREEKDKNYHLVERSYGSFSRSIELPADVIADKIKAVMANGVLKVTVPRTAKAEPKKIEVKAAV